MRLKTVNVNDLSIGGASTWAEVKELLTKSGVHLIGKPGVAEGPTGFYGHGTLATTAGLVAKDDRSTA